MPRKEKEYHYLYKTTNLINNKFYVGMHSTNDLEDGYLGSGKRLRYSINKYGKHNFVKEIITFFKNRNELIEAEKNLVNLELIQEELCMNLMIGGEGGFVSEKAQFKRSQAGGLKRKINLSALQLTNIGIKGGNSCKNKLKGIFDPKNNKYDWTGKNHKEETKNKIGNTNSIKQKGEKNSQYGTCWIKKEGINKKIKKEELNQYINLGWCKGRKIK